MEINKILTADVLDIIFDGRNKQYGAYDLRKTYNKRLRTSMLVMLGAVVALIVGYFISNYEGKGQVAKQVVQDVQLEDVKEEKRTNHRLLPLRQSHPHRSKWQNSHLPKL